MALRQQIATHAQTQPGYHPFSKTTAHSQLLPSLSGTAMQHAEDSAPPAQAAASPNLRKRQRTDANNDGAHHNPIQQPVAADGFVQDQDAQASGGEEDDEDEEKPKSDKKAGRRKIKIEFIQDKSRRHITFSKRKAGIMKKAYELSTLTGTQVLLLVVSETGLVYTFTTAKLQPLVTQPEGKNLIQACLNAPHGTLPSSMPVGTPLGRSNSGPMSMAGATATNNVPGGLSIGGAQSGKEEEATGEEEETRARTGEKRRRRASSTAGNQGASSTTSTQRGSPNSPAQPIPPSPLSMPGAAQGQSQAPSAHQIALNSPTTPGANASQQPQQPAGHQPTSPNYTHGPPPSGAYAHHAGQQGDPNMYAPHSMMQPPYYGQPPAGQGGHLPPQHWGQPPSVQGGAAHYGGGRR